MERRPPQAPDDYDTGPRLDIVERRRNARERRNRNRRRPDFRGPIRFLLMLLLIGQSLRVAFSSPRLRLEQVQVHGTQRLAPEEVTRLGKIPLGANIFRVNLVAVSNRLRKDPVIKEAVVTRELPGTVVVEVRERKPAYQLTCNGAIYNADQQGVLFERAQRLNPVFPRLELPASELPTPGQALSAERLKALKDCVRLARLERLPVTKMRVDDAAELWLNVTTNTRGSAVPATLSFRVGRTTELPEKFRDIRNVLDGFPDLAEKAALVDVMCPGRTSYVPRAESSETTNGPESADASATTPLSTP